MGLASMTTLHLALRNLWSKFEWGGSNYSIVSRHNDWAFYAYLLCGTYVSTTIPGATRDHPQRLLLEPLVYT